MDGFLYTTDLDVALGIGRKDGSVERIPMQEECPTL